MPITVANAKLFVINQASVKLGNGIVESIESNDPFVTNAKVAFDLVYPTMLSTHFWRFATAIQKLNLLLEKPKLDAWTYVLELPSTLLAIRRLDIFDYLIFENNVIYTNDKDVNCIYRKMVDIDTAPYYFLNVMSLALASHLAGATIKDANLQEILVKEFEVALAQSLFIDAQSQPASIIKDQPVLAARHRFGRNFRVQV